MLPEDRDTEDFTVDDIAKAIKANGGFYHGALPVGSPQPLAIELKGGTRLTPDQAAEALDAAMKIIERVGTINIEYESPYADAWMKRYYPQWA